MLRRALGDDASRWGHVCLPSRSLFSDVGFPVWLDVILRHRDRNNCRRGRRLRPFCRRTLASHLGRRLPDHAYPYLDPLRSLAFNSPTARNCSHRGAHSHQHCGFPLREARPECVYRREDHRARRIDRSRHSLWTQCGHDLCKFRRRMAPARCGCSGSRTRRDNNIWLVRGDLPESTGSLFSADPWHNIAFAAAK